MSSNESRVLGICIETGYFRFKETSLSHCDCGLKAKLRMVVTVSVSKTKLYNAENYKASRECKQSCFSIKFN